MTDVILQYAPFWVGMLLQTWWLSYHIGRVVTMLEDHELRLKRLENIQDGKFIRLKD